jgi:hypothetical protein
MVECACRLDDGGSTDSKSGLVLVAALAGGIRAATWIALAMRYLFEGQPAICANGTPTNCAVGDAVSLARAGSLLASGISGQ